MAPLRKIRPRATYAAWGLVLVAIDGIEAIRRRLVFSTVAVVAALAFTLVIVLPGAGVGSSAVAEGIAAADYADSESADSATEEKFFEVGGYSISLPDGWRNSPRPPGSAFAATSADGLATSTLWIRRNPSLGLEGFTRRSSRNLAKLGGEVEVIGRVDGDTEADSSVELSADVPLSNEPAAGVEGLVSTNRVTLRVAGPYLYYLATTIQPGAPQSSFDDAAELSHGLRPWLPS